MSETFKITVSGGRHRVEYTISDRSHDDTAVNATVEALRSYARHGHSDFPYNRDLKVRVERVEEDC